MLREVTRKCGSFPITYFVCTVARCGDAVRQPDIDNIRCLCKTTSTNDNITDITAVIYSLESTQLCVSHRRRQYGKLSLTKID